jgi:hypothetical protein
MVVVDGEGKLGLAPTGLLTDGKPLGVEGAGLLRLYAGDAASRSVRREMASVAKLAERTNGDRAAFAAGLDSLYSEHAETLARDLHIPRHEALRYARAHQAALLEQGPAVTADWLTDGVAQLTELAMDKPEALAA